MFLKKIINNTAMLLTLGRDGAGLEMELGQVGRRRKNNHSPQSLMSNQKRSYVPCNALPHELFPYRK